MSPTATIPGDVLEATRVLWDYHDLHQELRPADVGVGLERIEDVLLFPAHGFV